MVKWDVFFIYVVRVVVITHEIINNWLNKGWKKIINLVFIAGLQLTSENALWVLFNPLIVTIRNINIQNSQSDKKTKMTNTANNWSK